MCEIIPAVIPKSLADLENHFSRIVGLVPLAQVDVLDGKLTPKASWPYLYPHDDDFEKIIHEDEGMPYWEELDFEADLMVADPDAVVQDWISAGAKRIIVHRDSFASGEETLSFLESFSHKYASNGSLIGTELGLAITLDADLGEISSYIEYITVVQCMGIQNVGFQAQPFDERVLDNIRTLRSTFPDLIISIDGGVNIDSAPLLIEAGANRLVAGSAIFESDDPQAAIEDMESFDTEA